MTSPDHKHSPEIGVWIPDEFLPEGVSASWFDPDVLESAANYHRRHRFDHDMTLKASVVLYLLDHWRRTTT